jgi:hypothetical protein
MALTGSFFVGLGVLWAILLPFLPNTVFAATDNILVTLLLLVGLVYSLNFGALAGIFTFMAVALTFVERNRRKALPKLNATPVFEASLTQQLAPSPPMSPDEVHPAPETPEEDVLRFLPSSESGDNTFAPVAPSIDEKDPVPTIGPNNDKAEEFFLQHDLAKTTLLPQ